MFFTTENHQVSLVYKPCRSYFKNVHIQSGTRKEGREDCVGRESTQVKEHWWPLGVFSCLKNGGVMLVTRANTQFRTEVSISAFIRKG